jgi:hypothetical protein
MKRTPAAHAVLKKAGMPEGDTRDNRARVLVRKFSVGQEKRIAAARGLDEQLSEFVRIAGEQVCRDPLSENALRAPARVIDLRGASAVVEQFVAGWRPLEAGALLEQFVVGHQPLVPRAVLDFAATAQRVLCSTAEQGASQESVPASEVQELK